MKILLIHNFYQYWGGEDSYVTSLKKLLEKNGHEVYLYSKDSKNIKTFWDKIKVGIGLFYNPWVEKELIKIIKEFKPDIVQIQNIYPLITPIVYRVCKKFNIPIVQRISNFRWVCPKGLLFRKGKICELCVKKKFSYPSIIFGCYHNSRIATLLFSLSFYFYKLTGVFDLIDKIIFPTKFIQRYYLESIDFLSKNKTVVIPNFTLPEQNYSLKINNIGNYFIYVGRLSEEKGIISLLETFKSLPKVKLLIIGDGPLGKKINEYKEFKNIEFKQFLNRGMVKNYLSKAILCIVPSIGYDVFPNVIIESFSVGVPVILPNKSNFKNLIKNGKTGLYYDNNIYSKKNLTITIKKNS
ncbi:MAG: glycosyl transferase [Patescibacteria group bacterium]|nr:MAG: glycosyl transferase [Patescibacteria group bacterium]